MSWIPACKVGEIAPGEAIAVPSDPPIAVFNVDGEYFATGDRCSHDESSLADGYIDGDVVECAWHFAKFCIRSGELLSPPATVDIPRFEVRVEEDVVYVDTGE